MRNKLFLVSDTDPPHLARGGMVQYGTVALLPPIRARGFAEGGGVMQRLAGHLTQTDSGISACSEMGLPRRGPSNINTARHRRCLHRTKS
jgi:hypothetical protein